MKSHNLPDLFRLQRQIDRMFDEFISPFSSVGQMTPLGSDLSAPETALGLRTSTSFMPTCDIEDTESHYLMSFDLPGIKKEDIHIELRDSQLVVWGERKEEQEERRKNRYRSERSYGSFSRTFALPPGVKSEQIESHFQDGVLRLAVPKIQASHGTQIKIGEGKSSFWDRMLSAPKKVA